MRPYIDLRCDDLQARLAPWAGGAVADLIDHRGPHPRGVLRRSPAQLTNAPDAACFPLVPFSNRIRDGRFTFRGRTVRLSPNLPGQRHPLHGQGWRAAWATVEQSPCGATLIYRHPSGEWPWAYEARQVITVEARALQVRLSVINLSDQPMPCGLGLHPYFDCDAATVLDTAVGSVWTIDDEIMPVDLVPADGRYALRDRAICGAGLDNGYEGWCGQAVIRWPDEGRAVRIASPNAPRFQLYAPEGGGLLAAEPVTNANGAFEHPESEWPALGLHVLDPGEETALNTRFELLDGAC